MGFGRGATSASAESSANETSTAPGFSKPSLAPGHTSGSAFLAVQRGLKSVQVLFDGIEAAMVLTLIILR